LCRASVHPFPTRRSSDLGALPSKKELETHNKTLASSRRLPPKMIDLLRALPRKTAPMEVLRTGVSALSAFDPDAADNSREATLRDRKSTRLNSSHEWISY